MPHLLERAYQDVEEYGRALLKYITPNEVDYRQSHQCGYLIPIPAAYLFTPHEPVNGRNDKHEVSVLWPDGQVTNSVITWYGQRTRHEYRMTRYGRGSAWANNADLVGQLLVLIPKSIREFNGHILSGAEADELLDRLGVEIVGQSYKVFDAHAVEPIIEDSDACVGRLFRGVAQQFNALPTGSVMCSHTWQTLESCHPDFNSWNFDEQIVKLYESEYQLFRLIERIVHSPRLTTPFVSVDDFIQFALQLLNSRKARAGRSLENHVEQLMLRNHIPHRMRAPIPGEPDAVFPSVEAYNDPAFPDDQLIILAIKTTCKDRWRQILEEGPRVPTKHLLTLQPSLTLSQYNQMQSAGVRLIVPEEYHGQYPLEAQAPCSQ